MSTAALNERELRELCVELCAALHAVAGELESATDGEWPLPDSIEKGLRERNALATALAALPENVRGRLRTIYLAEMAKGYLDTSLFDPEPLIRFPLMDEIDARLQETLDRVRVARLRDSALHEEIIAHRDLPFGV